MSDPSQIQGFVNGLKDFFATVLEGVGAFVNGAAKIANIFLMKYKIMDEIIISSFDESLYLTTISVARYHSDLEVNFNHILNK